jgi:CheY-like chemotaxis protein
MRDEPGASGTPELSKLSVLVIDDDVLLLALFEKLLRGHAPTLVSNADEAVAHLRAGRRFDAIVCDLHMPGLKGPGFFDLLAAQWPEMADRIIFMSGGGGSDQDEAFLENHPTLMKPFRRKDLERMLSIVIANSKAPDSRPHGA